MRRVVSSAAVLCASALLVLADRPPNEASGKPTRSSTPLDWTHAAFVRLAWSIQAGHPVETPSIVACRYAGCR